MIATASCVMADRIRQAGADTVLDYRLLTLGQQIKDANNGQPVEHVVDLPFFQLLFKHVTLRIVLVYLLPYEDRLKAIMRLYAALAEGALKAGIEQTDPPEQASAAHEAVEAGHRQGAVLISFA